MNASQPIIMHGCNCQGVMGSGVAKAIRFTFPIAYDAYINDKPYVLGSFSTAYHTVRGKRIVNLYTQETFGRESGKKYASPLAIEVSVRRFIESLPVIRGIYGIAIPKIGCGLGGLSWENEVKEIFETIEKRYGVVFSVYEID